MALKMENLKPILSLFLDYAKKNFFGRGVAELSRRLEVVHASELKIIKSSYIVQLEMPKYSCSNSKTVYEVYT